MSELKHSLTLFGLTGPYTRGEMSFEQCLATAKQLGFDGIEFVAAQMMPSYPYNDPDWNRYFRTLCEKYELTPVCYSAYLDIGLRSDRDMNEREIFESTINDLQIAHDMGFSICRSQFSITPKVMEKCLPYAEKYGIHLAIEMHTPHTPKTPIWQEYLKLFRKMNSPYLGVVPDLSSFQEFLPPTFLVKYTGNRSVAEQLMAAFRQMASREELLTLCDQLGGSAQERELVDQMLTQGLRDSVDYDGFADFLTYSRYVHGKYFYVDERLNCPCIDYRRILGMMKARGFDGFLCTEFEGNKFDPHIDDLEQIRRHAQMTDKIWAEV